IQEHRNQIAQDKSDGTIADIVLAGNADGQAFSENDLVMFVLGTYIAGLDTAANTAAFLFYELLSHPLLLEQVLAEIDQVFADGVPSAQRLRGMRTFRGAFLETLRLHPVAPSLIRHAVEPFEFQGYQIDTGDEIL